MKRIIFAIAMIAGVCSANAQKSYEGSKFSDNWSIGIQGGIYQPTVGQNMIKDNRALVNLEIQKQFTPAFGLGLGWANHINSNNTNSHTHLFSTKGPKTAFDFSNLHLDGLVNLNNLFGGYKGRPWLCEVVARGGMGWGYIYGDCYPQANGSEYHNALTSNFGVDVNFNLGKARAWQINLKPGITYVINGGSSLNVNNSYLTLMAGVTYKFKNSNGTHNFVINNKKFTQEQMNELNEKINAERAAKENLQNQVAANQQTIKSLQDKLAAEMSKEKTVITTINKTESTTQLAPVVIYGLGKKTIDASQKPSVAMIATYMKNHPDAKVRIQGYASPEGNPELNQKLSEARAQAVFDMLVKQYGISPDRLEVKGMGATDELFDENDWNRVATFIETNPKTTTTTTTTTSK